MFVLKKTENNDQESGANEKQEIVALSWEFSAKKSLSAIVCGEQSVPIQAEGHF